MTRMILKNSQGHTVRVIELEGEECIVVYRGDTRRVEFFSNVVKLDKRKIEYKILVKTSSQEINQKGFLEIPNVGRLYSEQNITDVVSDVCREEESQKFWWLSLSSVGLVAIAFIALLLSLPQKAPNVEEELKQHVVKVIKRAPKPTPVEKGDSFAQKNTKQTQKKETKKAKKKNIKRLGALAVLGRINKSRSKGGLDLGAASTSYGPGLGGKKGSGGVQTSLYGKGLIGAPVGAGDNVKGAGGYGTKGKGGGKDGYGQLSLIGSSGTASIPLGREAIIQGGLDQGLIAEVIQKNMGQVRFCYEQGLQTDPKLSGRVAVSFIIGSNGRIKSADLKSTTLHSSLVEQCIVMRLKTWKFPIPEGGVDVKVSYPFLLRRLGSS